MALPHRHPSPHPNLESPRRRHPRPLRPHDRGATAPQRRAREHRSRAQPRAAEGEHGAHGEEHTLPVASTDAHSARDAGLLASSVESCSAERREGVITRTLTTRFVRLVSTRVLGVVFGLGLCRGWALVFEKRKITSISLDKIEEKQRVSSLMSPLLQASPGAGRRGGFPRSHFFGGARSAPRSKSSCSGRPGPARRRLDDLPRPARVAFSPDQFLPTSRRAMSKRPTTRSRMTVILKPPATG